jgi:GNAT superfamily N-acetyltransferase
LAERFEIRQLDHDTPEGWIALHLAVDAAAPSPPQQHASPVRDLLAHVARQSLRLELLFGAYRAGRLVSAAAAVESPGASAMIFAPFEGLTPLREDAGVAVLERLKEAAWDRSIKLLQVLFKPEATALARLLDRAGFVYLTRLLYLQREAKGATPSGAICADFTWLPFSKEHEDLFLTALSASYVQSLDCPELIGIRTPREVLEGHRATGIHDPYLWWVALRGAEVVGVLLLTRVAGQPWMEIVYIGVAASARGKGVSDALLAKAFTLCGQYSAKVMTLAVDRGNTPARRMYDRWGFVQTNTRDAWIATSKRGES